MLGRGSRSSDVVPGDGLFVLVEQPRLVGVCGRPGDVLAVHESLVVLVQDFGPQQELLEGDLVEEAGVGAAGISVRDLCSEMAVLCCAGDGAAGAADDVPGQCST